MDGKDGAPGAAGQDGAQGPPGADGAQGPPGPTGKTAYQYAVDGGYTGTEADFQALMGTGPWLPIAGGEMTGDIAGIISKGEIDLFQQNSSTSSGINFYGSSPSDMRSGIWGTDDGEAAIKGARGLGYGNLLVNTPSHPYHAASKSYVDSVASGVPSGVIVMWSGAESAIPAGWVLCNGTNGTPDLRDRFIVGAGLIYNVGATGGSNSVTLTVDQMPMHTHTDSIGLSYNNESSLTPAYGSGQCLAYNVPTNYTGGSKPHENRPPYYALCYIMKQ